MTGEEATETLARRLYENAERLDPSDPEEVEWEQIRERDRLFWRSLVRDIARYEAEWQALFADR